MGREYGDRAWFGLGVPQANPTVEPELRRLLPASCECYTVRLDSAERDGARRLAAYLHGLEGYLERYGGLALDAFGFAMTGAAYVVGHEEERRVVEASEARFGYPVVTASAAIEAALGRLGARRIQLVSPYPDFLVAAARTYWQGRGLEVVRVTGIARIGTDLDGIYTLTSDDAIAALGTGVDATAEAVVFSGTGLPTLALLERAPGLTDLPVLSSNACLAESLLALAPAGGEVA